MELMVSMAILGLILIFFTQIVLNVSTATGTGRQRLDIDASARIALDLMASDFANKVKRKDVDFLVLKNPGNDAFYFYSETPALSGSGSIPDTVALVGYQVVSGTSGTCGLQRTGMGLPLGTGTGGMALYPSRLDQSTLSTIPASAIQPLCKEVLRMEIEFMKTDGTFLALPPTRQDSGKPDYSYVTTSGTLGTISANQVPDWDGLRAIVVTIVCLDREKQVLLSQSDLDTILNTFGDTTTANWDTLAESTSFPKVGRALRVYRRFFPIQ